MKMSEYGKGYILKNSLNSVIDWDNDIEKWTIRDDDLESLMTEDNDVVEVTRCEDCKNLYPDDTGKLHWCDFHRMFVGLDDFCNYGK